ncbi:MAG: Cysteine synthase B [Syntrophomonadaceae bacterium]|nr:Cysteine synthase B [Bacillota bacterium]
MSFNTQLKIHYYLDNLAKQVGNTPLIPIVNVAQNPKVRIFAKVEWQQISGSVKARAAFGIIKQALLSGLLNDGKILLDATSGNTGIAYATIAKELGFRVALCLPENASEERKEILSKLGADIIFTSKFGGTDEAQAIAADLARQYPEKYFYANQYTNENNWKAHYYGTAEEIIRAVPQITHFVAGLGTTGTFMGTTKRLKEFNPAIKAVALQPDLALHGLEGWKHLATAVVPKFYDQKIVNQTIEITTSQAYDIIKNSSYISEALLSPSAAANVLGAIALSNQIDSGTVVTVLPDNADKYGEVLKQIR